jgi:hypothetical protein
VIQTFLCPSNPRRGSNQYAGCHHDVDAPIDANNHGVLYLNSRVAYDDIKDGLPYTILLGEIEPGGPSLGWPSGTRATLRNTGHRLNEPDYLFRTIGRSQFATASEATSKYETVEQLVADGLLPIGYTGGFGSHHSHGANFLFCNGSVRFVRESVNSTVYEHLGNRDDGEIISDDAF